jgi:hypothetical protein
VLRAAGETETTQDWLQLDEGDPGFQLLTEEEIAAVIFIYLFSSELPTSITFPFTCFLRVFSFRVTFCFTNRDNPSPKLIRICYISVFRMYHFARAEKSAMQYFLGK